MDWLSAGWGSAGCWGGGVRRSAAPTPVQLYACGRHKSRAWDSPATVGTVKRKGTEGREVKS